MSSIVKNSNRKGARNNNSKSTREYMKCGCYYESMEEDTVLAFRPICLMHTIKGRRYEMKSSSN
jgi:hypothetical protein